jgi:hypothetical protein
MFFRFAALALVLIPPLLSRQQAVPPPPKPIDPALLPKPSDPGPSLDVTLAFIKSKIESIGDLTFSTTDDNDPAAGAQQGHTGYYLVGIDSKACTIQLEKHYQTNVRRDTILIREISRVTLMLHGQPEYPELHYSPQLPALKIYFATSSANSVWIWFGDDDVADRVAKALTHASELCGGGNKDPF